MALILRKEGNSNVTTPPAGSGAIFLSTEDAITVKSSTGNVSSILTFTGDTDTEVFFNDGGELGQSNTFTFDKSTGTLDVSDLITEEITTTGNVTVGGNLVVDGNITYVNVENFNVEDPVIGLGGGPNGDPLTSDDGKDRGTVLHYYDTDANAAVDAFMGWDTSNSEFGFGSTVISNQDTTQSIEFVEYGNIRAAQFLGTGGFFTETLSVGSNVELSNNFPDATTVVTQYPLDITEGSFMAVVGQASADSSGTPKEGIGIHGLGSVEGDVNGTGILGRGLTSNTADTGTSVGVAGMATDTNDGMNIGLSAEASGSTDSNYALYIEAGDISSTQNSLAWELTDDTPNALSFHAPGKSDVFKINTENGAEGVSTSGKLTVDGNLSTDAILTDNYFTANGDPLDFQRPSGSNTQIQFNDDDDFGASVNLTFDSDTNELSVTGTLDVSGNASVGNIDATNGTFTEISGTLTTAAQPNVTSVGTLTSLDVTGNANTGNLDTTNINATNDISATTLGGSLTTASQPNVTSLGTLDSLGVTGAITASNIIANTGIFTGNGSGLSAITGANVTGEVSFANTANSVAGSNVGGQVGNALIAGTVYTNAQPNITSVGTLTSLDVSGNVEADNISANSDISATTLGGTLTTSDQPNITSVGTLTSLDVTGNVDADNISATNDISATTLGGTLTTAAQPNVTSVGTLTALDVTGNATAANVYANSGTVGASLLTGTLTTATQPNITSVGTLTSLDVTGNVDANNLSATNDISATTLGGSLTTASQPNVTSLGTLTSLDVTGNASAGNISTAGELSVTGNANVGNLDTTNVEATTLAGSLTTNAQPNITSVGTLTSLNVTGNISAENISGNNANFSSGGVFGANVDMSDKNIIDLADPVNSKDAATKQYVDEVAEGLKARPQVEIGTTADLNATYDNGNAGIGATLTASSNGAFPEIDGVTLTSTTLGENGVLVKDQTDAAENGRYNLIQVGDASNPWILERCGLCDESDEIPGSFTFIKSGDTLANTGWVQTVTDPSTFVIGTDPIIVTQFSGAGTFTAGTGLTLDGTEFNINNAQPTVTSVGTLTGLDVNGNIIAANITANTGVFTGNGSGLSNLTGSNVSGQVSNALIAGTVYTNAQPNITSVGTLTSLSVTGNASAGNLSTGGTLSVTGNANVGNIGANSGVFTSISGDGSALTSLDANSLASGTVPSGRLSGSYAIDVDSATTAGTVTTNAQPNITSVGTLTSLDVSGNANIGNVDATNFIGSGASLTSLNASNLSSGTVPSGRLSGSYAIDVDSATTAGTVTTAAQPNITSVGTLSSLAISGTNDLTVRSITTGANTTTGTIEGDWSLTAGSKLNATYADLAECYTADYNYEPGTVVVFGGSAEVTEQGVADNRAVAGVVSTNPAYLMNSECEGDHVVQLALIGRVPCKVIGPVSKGDLIVTSDQAGFAKTNNEPKSGSIIGKALENLNEGTEGLIEVLVGRC